MVVFIKPVPHSNPLRLSDDLASALNLLRAVVGESQQQLLDPEERETTKMVYTQGVTLWMLILQRLGGGKSLAEVISQILTHDRDLLPDTIHRPENACPWRRLLSFPTESAITSARSVRR